MKWIIPATEYQVWKDFSLKLTNELSFETGMFYHLKGNNGAGKSSFIKKVLIPLLQKKPEQQYIFYIEQQIQSQFDAIKAYAALQKPSVQINNFNDMILYQLNKLSEQSKVSKRPMMVILDECSQSSMITEELSKFTDTQYCILFVDHSDCSTDMSNNSKDVIFKSVSAQLTEVCSV